jgi:hypothetical protein
MSIKDVFASLISFFSSSSGPWLITWLPWTALFSVGLWFGIVGWRRHRSRAFLLFLGSYLAGILAQVMNFCYMGLLSPQRSSLRPTSFLTDALPMFYFSQALSFISVILALAALWIFVYRTSFAARNAQPDYRP